MNLPIERFDHPVWVTSLATAIGYGIILTVMTVLLFAIPYLVFMQL
jgi:hypothetical protein